MKKKLLAAAIASALVAPAGSLAAQDTSGMRYTSASEGFYASLRVQFNSGGENTDDNGNVTDDGAGIENSTSRFGVRGSNDLGNGWQGFYQYEAGVDIDNGGGLSTRLAHVGVRGGFGQLQVGTFWPASYNWVHGTTDVANWASGSFIHTALLPGRQSRALEYTTPDLNGFQAAAFIEMDPNRDGAGALAPATPPVPGTPGTMDTFRQADFDFDDSGGANEASADNVRDADRSRLLVAQATNGDSGNPTTRSGLLSPTTYGIAADADLREGTSTGGVTFFYFDFGSGGVGAYDINDLVVFEVSVVDVPGTPGTDPIPAGGNPKDDNDIDLWSLSSKYSFQGFDAGISYTVAPDGLEKSSGSRKDLSLYALRFGYAQDNWYVTSWYAEDNAGDDVNREHDTETFSLAAGIAVGKANLYAIYEQQESDNYQPETATTPAVASTGSHDDESATFGVQYNLGSRSRVWIEYVSRDYESADVENYTTIGLRHDL